MLEGNVHSLDERFTFVYVKMRNGLKSVGWSLIIPLLK